MGRKGRAEAQPLEVPEPVLRVRAVRFVPEVESWYSCVCWQCKKPFTSKRPDARYHNDACRQKAYRLRQKARMQHMIMQQEGNPLFNSPLR